MTTISTKKLLAGSVKFVLPLFVLLLIQIAANAQTYTQNELSCFGMVQGKVAWNKAGEKGWSEGNIRSLCKSTTDPATTISCFTNVINNFDDWNRGIRECSSAPPPKSRLFPDGAKINLFADNGYRMTRCNGCQDTLNNSLPDTIILGRGGETQFSTFVVKNDPATGNVMLESDNGKKFTYCNGCITGGAIYAEQLVLEVSDSNYIYNKFELAKLSNGKYTLRAPNGKYLSRCDGCSPSLQRRTGNANGNVVMPHISDPNSIYAQWTITLPGETAPKIPGSSGGRTFDQYAWLTSHNSFVNYTDALWTTPNQSRGIIGQIQTDGVRGLMLDIYDFEGTSNFGGAFVCGFSAGADCYEPGIYMCHGGCRGFPGATYALPRQNLKDTLNAVGDWLANNRGLKDVITIFFEDYTSGGTLAKLIKTTKAAPYIFNPYGEWKVTEKGFPTLEYMQTTNERLIIFTSKSANKDTSLGIAHDQDFNVENYWSIGAGGADYECKTRWGSILLNKTESNFKRLFVMNHFRDVPNPATATFDNKESNLKDRLTKCQTAAGRLPNFLALDYVELGSGKALVDSINTEWKKQISP